MGKRSAMASRKGGGRVTPFAFGKAQWLVVLAQGEVDFPPYLLAHVVQAQGASGGILHKLGVAPP